MKKSVILSISVIYIFAVVIVGFLGLKMKVYNPTQFVEEIQCLTPGYKEYSVGSENYANGYSGYINLRYVEGLEVELKFQIIPENATNKMLTFSKSTKPAEYEVITNPDGTATVRFYTSTSADIIVKAADNRGESIKIKINVVRLDI